MDELRDLVGERFELVERFPVEAGKIAEFAEAITDVDSLYLDDTGDTARERGFENVPAPPTFTMSAAFFRERQDMEGRPDVTFDRSRTVHGEQSFEYERPPVAGDVLSADGELRDIYQKEGASGPMTFAEWEATYRDQDGDPVVRAFSTVIELPPGDDDQKDDD